MARRGGRSSSAAVNLFLAFFSFFFLGKKIVLSVHAHLTTIPIAIIGVVNSNKLHVSKGYL